MIKFNLKLFNYFHLEMMQAKSFKKAKFGEQIIKVFPNSANAIQSKIKQ